MSLYIQGGQVLRSGTNGDFLDEVDLVIQDNRIFEIGRALEPGPDAQVLNARGKLVIPGLINAHCHSDELLLRGMLDKLPLEPWMLYSLPLYDYGPFSPRLLYLRTMLGAIEMLQSGVTAVQDDVSESPHMTLEGARAVRQAYADIGIRANVTCNQANLYEFEKVPYLRELLPPDELARMQQAAPMSEADILAFYREVIREWHGAANGRLRVTLSFSAPQRCTPSYMQSMFALAEEFDLPLHMHILETKTQRVTGEVFFHKSVIQYARELDLLSPRTTIVHAIWLDDADIATMGMAGANVAHNPASNLKLGSGIMPLRKLVRAGVNVALGTDGASSNDSVNIWECLKLAATLHRMASPHAADWPDASEAFQMGTQNGAHSMLLDSQVGKLEPGYKADLALLDLHTPAFTPLNDAVNQLVYCENGSSVDTVIVDGRIVVAGGRVMTVDAGALLDELNALMPEYREHYRRARVSSDRLAPYYWQAYQNSVRQDVGLNRWAADAASEPRPPEDT